MLHVKDNIVMDSEFPFDMYDAPGQPDIKRIHKHDCLEINYVMSGKGYYIFEDQKYELHPGDVYMINNREYHATCDAESIMLKVIVFNADLVWNGSRRDYVYLKAFWDRKEGELPFLNADLPVTKAIVALILDMEKEWKEKKLGYKILIKADLMKILGMVYREYGEMKRLEDGSSKVRNNFQEIIRILDYVDAHYKEPLSLQEMADMVHMSKSYFSGVFSEAMQKPFSKYVLEKRLHQACILLKTTDKLVTDIAVEVGFDTINYFNKAFKKKYGVSPGSYRINQKKEDIFPKES